MNVLSTASLAAVPLIPGYSISKAAAYSFTQVLRGLLAPQGVRVHAVLAGPIDTEMSQDLDIPKTAPDAVAAEILAAVADGVEDIFPDPAAAVLAAGWSTPRSRSCSGSWPGWSRGDPRQTLSTGRFSPRRRRPRSFTPRAAPR